MPRRITQPAPQQIRRKHSSQVSSNNAQTSDLNVKSDIMTPDDVLNLQRTLGNKATKQIMEAKQKVQTLEPPTDESTTETQSDTEIQRLPSKSTVESTVGKSGFYVFTKTSWANFLENLDKYNNAVKKKDKDKQLTTVIALQTYTNKWLTSESRDTTNEKKKKADQKKRDFLNKLKPDLQILYYELKNKSKTVDVVKENAAENADENIQLIKEKLLQKNIQTSNEKIKSMLSTLMSAKLTYNFNPDVLGFLMASPEFKTIWQLKYASKSPGGTIPSEYDKMTGSEKREAAERWLGYDPFSEDQRDNRPAYVGVNVLNNPKGAAPGYGRFFFEFKDSIKDRTTYTPYDTFEMISNSNLKDIPEKTTSSNDNMEAILAYNDGVLEVLANMENDIDMTEKEIQKAMARYMEGQVHGGLTVDDVDTLVVNYSRNPDEIDEFDQPNAELAKKFIEKYPHVKLRYQS